MSYHHTVSHTSVSTYTHKYTWFIWGMCAYICVCVYIYTHPLSAIFSFLHHLLCMLRICDFLKHQHQLMFQVCTVPVPVCVSASGEERAHCMLYLCSGLWSSPLLVLLHFWLRYWQFKARPCWEDRREKLKLLSIYCRVIDLRIILIFFIFPKSLNSHEFSAPSEENQAHNKAKPMAMLAESRLIHDLHTAAAGESQMASLDSKLTAVHLFVWVWRTIKIKENIWMQLSLLYSKWSILSYALNDHLLHLNGLLETRLLMKPHYAFS